MTLQYDIAQKHASDVKMGMYVILTTTSSTTDNPCKINNISVAKTGKHGHMKVSLSGVDLITNKNINWTVPGHNGIITFNPIKKLYQIVDVEEDNVECLDENTNVITIKVESSEILAEIKSTLDS